MDKTSATSPFTYFNEVKGVFQFDKRKMPRIRPRYDKTKF